MTNKDQMNEMLERLLAMRAELAPAIAAMRKLEADIRSFALETGELGDCEGVEVQYREGYERIGWDTNALLKLAATTPNIMEAAKFSPVAPTIAIKEIRS